MGKILVRGTVKKIACSYHAASGFVNNEKPLTKISFTSVEKGQNTC